MDDYIISEVTLTIYKRKNDVKGRFCFLKSQLFLDKNDDFQQVNEIRAVRYPDRIVLYPKVYKTPFNEFKKEKQIKDQDYGV